MVYLQNIRNRQVNAYIEFDNVIIIHGSCNLHNNPQSTRIIETNAKLTDVVSCS